MAHTATQKRTESSARKVEGTPAATDAAPAKKRLPVKTIRVGDCSASIWSREATVQGEPRSFYSVSLERSYKDRDGSWKYLKSFDRDHLGSVIQLCKQADEAIGDLETEDYIESKER